MVNRYWLLIAPLALCVACVAHPRPSTSTTSTQVWDAQAQQSRAERLGHDACAAAPVEDRDFSNVTGVRLLTGLAMQDPGAARTVLTHLQESVNPQIGYSLTAAIDQMRQACPNADRDVVLRGVLVGCKDALASTKEATP